MKERILKIEEVFGYEVESGGKSYDNKGDGFVITTDRQEIKFLISSNAQCCESWGQIFMNDNPQDFIGSKIINIETIGTALDKKKIDDLGSIDCGEISFLNINTDKGTLQLAVYDSHNGYYGHSVFIRSNQLTA